MADDVSSPFLSVVVPTWNEEGNVGGAVDSAWAAGADEVIVADGGSEDRTTEEAEAAGALVVPLFRSVSDTSGKSRTTGGARGRGPQQNAGAARAKGEVLLFLHADSRLPVTAAARIRRALVDPGAVGGRFDVRLDHGGLLLRTVEGMINWRSRHTGIHTGDQAIFVRRAVFERLGGFESIPLFEDVRLTTRLRRHGRVVAVRDRVTTSARRWVEGGRWRTILRMWRLRAAHANGAEPKDLARRYSRGS